MVEGEEKRVMEKGMHGWIIHVAITHSDGVDFIFGRTFLPACVPPWP
jgi:hypothetical protein